MTLDKLRKMLDMAVTAIENADHHHCTEEGFSPLLEAYLQIARGCSKAIEYKASWAADLLTSDDYGVLVVGASGENYVSRGGQVLTLQ